MTTPTEDAMTVARKLTNWEAIPGGSRECRVGSAAIAQALTTFAASRVAVAVEEARKAKQEDLAKQADNIATSLRRQGARYEKTRQTVFTADNHAANAFEAFAAAIRAGTEGGPAAEVPR